MEVIMSNLAKGTLIMALACNNIYNAEGGPSILMMVAGLIVFSVGSAFFGGLGG